MLSANKAELLLATGAKSRKKRKGDENEGAEDKGLFLILSVAVGKQGGAAAGDGREK